MNDQLRFHLREIRLLAVASLFLVSCASLPDFGDSGLDNVRTVKLTDETERIEGRNENGDLLWTAIRSRLRFDIPHPVVRSGSVRSQRIDVHLSSGSAAAVINGSAHDPIRLRIGARQRVLGRFMVDGQEYSSRSDQFDALGLTPGGQPVLVMSGNRVEPVESMIPGFHAILVDGVPREPVPTRDAVSAAGWNGDGTMSILFVAAGRDGSGYSYGEAGALMAELGAVHALTMDGGGSARLAWIEDGVARSFPAGPQRRFVPNVVLIGR